LSRRCSRRARQLGGSFCRRAGGAHRTAARSTGRPTSISRLNWTPCPSGGWRIGGAD